MIDNQIKITSIKYRNDVASKEKLYDLIIDIMLEKEFLDWSDEVDRTNCHKQHLKYGE